MCEASGGLQCAPVGERRADAMNEPQHGEDLVFEHSLGYLHGKEGVEKDHATQYVNDALSERKQHGKWERVQVRLVVNASCNARNIPPNHQQRDAKQPIIPYSRDETHSAAQQRMNTQLKHFSLQHSPGHLLPHGARPHQVPSHRTRTHRSLCCAQHHPRSPRGVRTQRFSLLILFRDSMPNDRTHSALFTLLTPYHVAWTDKRHVGVYWRGGALIPGITEPGFHFKVPFLDKFAPVQISVQVRYSLFLSVT